MWDSVGDQNSLPALIRAIQNGYGIETDVRDLDGELVIAHDPPRAGQLCLDDFLEAYRAGSRNPMLALNIKADGLHQLLSDALSRHGIENYFVFDMSVPDTMGYLRRSMPIAARVSEFEPIEPFAKSTKILWVDAFQSEWYGGTEVIKWLQDGWRLAIVSPELHRRSHLSLWQALAKVPKDLSRNIYLCTDLFKEAQRTFHVVAD